jgi:hypothetical protein
MKPRAKIISAYKGWYGGDSEVLFGLCTEHEARPELVGEDIHTSRIMKIDGNIVETRNTIYEVEWLDADHSNT